MKQRGVFLIGLILISIYYFLFPRGSGRELIITPDSLTSLELTASSAGFLPGRTLAISSGSRAGFVNDDHELMSFYSSDKMAVDDHWLAVSGVDGLDLLEPDGRLIARIPDSSFPVSRNGNLYLYRDDTGVLLKIDPTSGRIMWRMEYISPVTVLDGRQGRTLVGLLDGRVQLIDDSGKLLLGYSPGGSRVEAIYGGALSSNGSKIALISGLEPQRFILLEERKNGFRPVAHHNTETNFRRSVSIGFVRDDRQILYESDGFVTAVDLNGYVIQTIELSGRLVGWLDNLMTDTLILLGREDDDVIVKILSQNDLTLFESRLPIDTTGILRDRNYALVIGGDNLGVLEFSVQ